MKTLLQAGAAAAAIVSIVGLWLFLGGPLPASSGDIKRLDRSQADTAEDIYARQLRGYILNPPPNDPIARKFYEEEIANLRDKLRRASERKIELSK